LAVGCTNCQQPYSSRAQAFNVENFFITLES
jgi:hypothetical protein